jgi:uncharacterized protein YdeI (YjbR/CyaY-like superfamily)
MKPDVTVPADFAASLKKNRQAALTFEAYSPSHRHEHLKWITEAKREETRQRRIEKTIEQLSKGKSRS